MPKLDGKIALISGGTTGIGAASARLFQAEGATVIVTGSNPDTLEAARSALPGIEVVASDAGDVAAIRALVDAVASRHGRIDVLFVNAGIFRLAPASAVDEAAFDLQFNVNVRGAFFLLKHALPVLSDGGSVILSSSIAGVVGNSGMSVYAATKAALRSFGRTFASELAPRRIRINTISPGPIETPILSKASLSAEQLSGMQEQMLAAVPLRRVGQPDEVAKAALFLASDDSSFTTGAELFVDGGAVDL